tara:strand:- start:561 stop:926 length:366 start_codon:yes stop_codon:yes gene_type:complete
MNIILISLISVIIFGVIDGLFFLLAEETLQNKIKKLNLLDDNSVELITGGFSAAFAIFISSFIEYLLEKKFKLITNPFLDSLGILIGTFMVVGCYNLFLRVNNTDTNTTNTTNTTNSSTNN